MEDFSTDRIQEFPPRLGLSEAEAFGMPESFTWGPQALWLLCGLVWNFWFLVRNIPELARNTAPAVAGATLAAALGIAYDLRRRRRRSVLYSEHERIGLYRDGSLQYSFSRAEMRRVRPDFEGWVMLAKSLLLPIVALTVIVGMVMLETLRQPRPPVSWKEMSLFVCVMLFGFFGFAAFYRSFFRLAHFWVPDAKGRPNKVMYLHPRELRKLENTQVHVIG